MSLSSEYFPPMQDLQMSHNLSTYSDKVVRGHLEVSQNILIISGGGILS